MTKEAMNVFNKNNLESLAMLEQDMVMGETASGESVKNVVGSVTNFIRNPNLSTLDKLRLLMIYTMSQEGSGTGAVLCTFSLVNTEIVSRQRCFGN